MSIQKNKRIPSLIWSLNKIMAQRVTILKYKSEIMLLLDSRAVRSLTSLIQSSK